MMADTETVEEVNKRQRCEQRDLQAKITQKKKNATKKTRKGINDECSALEWEMSERHIAELAAFKSDCGVVEGPVGESDGEVNDNGGNEKESSNKGPYSETLDSGLPSNALTSNTTQAKKPNRHKARLARRAADQAAAMAQAENEAADLPDRRAEEQAVIVKELEARGLEEREVRSDGHCLYAAIADQLRHRNVNPKQHDILDYKAIRNDAASFMEQHPDEFTGFLEEPLDVYVAKVRYTGEWGGQLELSALARDYGTTINVIQGNGRTERIEPDSKTPQSEIWLAYYRHSFGLGEHYNSLRTKP